MVLVLVGGHVVVIGQDYGLLFGERSGSSHFVVDLWIVDGRGLANNSTEFNL